MVINQGSIIKFDFNTAVGHEQVGYRSAVVISNNIFNSRTNLLIVLPITNTNNSFPLHVELDDRTTTIGVVLCEHPKSIDKLAKKIIVVESLPKDILKRVLSLVRAEISIEEK